MKIEESIGSIRRKQLARIKESVLEVLPSDWRISSRGYHEFGIYIDHVYERRVGWFGRKTESCTRPKDLGRFYVRDDGEVFATAFKPDCFEVLKKALEPFDDEFDITLTKDF